MSVRAVTYYEVVCDRPGCSVRTGTRSEYAAWAEAEQAETDWTESEGVVWEGKTYCRDCTPPDYCPILGGAHDVVDGVCEECGIAEL